MRIKSYKVGEEVTEVCSLCGGEKVKIYQGTYMGRVNGGAVFYSTHRCEPVSSLKENKCITTLLS